MKYVARLVLEMFLHQQRVATSFFVYFHLFSFHFFLWLDRHRLVQESNRALRHRNDMLPCIKRLDTHTHEHM